MSILDKIRDWSPIAVGEAAPALSLTADEGTWVRMNDFKDHINVILIFFRSLNRDEVDSWLKGYQANRDNFEELETAIFGVTTSRTDRLRDYRNSLGLDFYLLYDPFGLDSRKFKCSGRIRPFCKDSLVVVDKSGRIAFSQRGRPEAEEILRFVADLGACLRGSSEALPGGYKGIETAKGRQANAAAAFRFEPDRLAIWMYASLLDVVEGLYADSEQLTSLRPVRRILQMVIDGTRAHGGIYQMLSVVREPEKVPSIAHQRDQRCVHPSCSTYTSAHSRAPFNWYLNALYAVGSSCTDG